MRTRSPRPGSTRRDACRARETCANRGSAAPIRSDGRGEPSECVRRHVADSQGGAQRPVRRDSLRASPFGPDRRTRKDGTRRRNDDGEGRRRQDDSRICHRHRIGPPRASGTSQHDRPSGSPGGYGRRICSEPVCEPDRSRHGNQPIHGSRPGESGAPTGRAGDGPACGGLAITLYRGNRGVQCVRANSGRRGARLRGARHSSHWTHHPVAGCGRSVPPRRHAHDERRAGCRAATPSAASRRRFHSCSAGDVAGGDSRSRSGAVAGRPQAGRHQALRLDHQPELRGRGIPRSGASGARLARGSVHRGSA